MWGVRLKKYTPPHTHTHFIAMYRIPAQQILYHRLTQCNSFPAFIFLEII